MTAAPPGGRALAGWWRQLGAEPLGPVRAVGFAHLLLHRVEALFEVRATTALDPVSRQLLRTLASGTASVADLDAVPRLGGGFVARLLDGLRADGLAEPNDAGSWSLTTTGRDALSAETLRLTRRERRALHFIEGHPPHFLSLRPGLTLPLSPDREWGFDTTLISECLSRSEEWKSAHDFPSELAALVAPEPGAWRSVVLDRAEQVSALLIVRDDGLAGHAVRGDATTLDARPAFRIASGWRTVFPSLATEPSEEAWRQAWREWCQPRNVPAAEAEACSLQREGHGLKVGAPAKLIERLRAARSDVFRGEAWLLAGGGPVRSAALVALTES